MPSSAPYPKSSPVSRTKADTSLMRDKNGCITCRVRQKKCTGIKPGDTDCGDCMRLNIQCLGVQHNRPDWLRNPDALKETKYRIKHHLTEYPVPRGRGPAPERPYLDFQDLIELYSPRMPGSEASSPISPHSTQLYRMEPESPTYSQAGGYLSAQPHHGRSFNPPSPISPYYTMPLTPTSSEGNLFAHTGIQCDRHQHSEPLFLASPKTHQLGYDFQSHVDPGPRRQLPPADPPLEASLPRFEILSKTPLDAVIGYFSAVFKRVCRKRSDAPHGKEKAQQ